MGTTLMPMEKLLFILFFVLAGNSNAQYKRSLYCDCKIEGAKILNDLNEQKVNLSSNYSEGNLHLKVTNNTKDTIFIFKSYFDKDISTSNYVYRYDKKNNKINISFAPLLPYLFTKYSDRVIFDNRIIKDYQVVYDFYKIPPFYEYLFSVPVIDFKRRKDFITDFNVSELNKFEKIKRFKTKKLNQKKPSFVVSVAYYNNVETLCNSNSYYQEELKFNSAAKDFKILQSAIQ